MKAMNKLHGICPRGIFDNISVSYFSIKTCCGYSLEVPPQKRFSEVLLMNILNIGFYGGQEETD